MTTNKILIQLADEPKTNAKIQILKDNIDNELLKSVFQKALNPFINYYIKKIPDYNHESNELSLESAIELLDKLANREFTGHAGINHLAYILSNVNEDDAEVIKKIIKGDLRCGVQSSTTNKVWKGLIPEFPYQRCSLTKHVKLDEWPWSKGVYSQLKADGMYINANFHEDNTIELLSRNGNPMPVEQFSNIIDYMQRHLQNNTQTHGELVVKRDGFILPREIGNGILNSISEGNSFADNECPLFLIWDQIPLSEAIPKGKGTVRYADRYHPLKNQVASQAITDPQHVQMIETKLVFSWEEAFKHYLELVEQGLEGTIIKHPEAKWRDGTSKEQVKLKLEVDVDLKIVGFTQGQGKNAELFGAITCQSSDGLLEVNTSGFTDELRKDIFNRREQLLGTIITVRSNNIMPPTSTNKYYSLFLPRYVENRKDKTEADSLQQILDQFDSAMGKSA
jgi:DNA ligase-1